MSFSFIPFFFPYSLFIHSLSLSSIVSSGFFLSFLSCNYVNFNQPAPTFTSVTCWHMSLVHKLPEFLFLHFPNSFCHLSFLWDRFAFHAEFQGFLWSRYTPAAGSHRRSPLQAECGASSMPPTIAVCITSRKGHNDGLKIPLRQIESFAKVLSMILASSKIDNRDFPRSISRLQVSHSLDIISLVMFSYLPFIYFDWRTLFML